MKARKTLITATDRLQTLKVSEVMSQNVVEVSAHQTMEEVATQFAAHNISAAPVIDELGHCVGMLSAADYLKRACPRHGRGETAPSLQDHLLVHGESSDSLEIGSVRDTVDCYMASTVQSIAADASLLEASRTMCGAHLHRLPVLDGRLVVGIISTMDIVATLLNTIDEMEAD